MRPPGRARVAGLAAAATALAVLSACSGPDAADLERQRTVPAPVEVPGDTTTQPATLAYGATAAGVEGYAHPGALVVAGRENFGAQEMKDVSAAGGTVLVYLDPMIDNDYGRYHRLLLRDSACGPEADRWPGNPPANEYGDLADFRVGSVIGDKLRCVMETMAEENPHMAGWFLDDVGSRSYFADLDWDAFDADEKQAYRDGAIALTRTAREVADSLGMVFMVNGTWGAGDVAEAGGGYPDPDQHGNALADGGFVENHDRGLEYFAPYSCSEQWAAESSVTEGEDINFAVTETVEGLQAYVDSGCFAYAQRHVTYDVAAPWGDFLDRGLPSRVGG